MRENREFCNEVFSKNEYKKLGLLNEYKKDTSLYEVTYVPIIFDKQTGKELSSWQKSKYSQINSDMKKALLDEAELVLQNYKTYATYVVDTNEVSYWEGHKRYNLMKKVGLGKQLSKSETEQFNKINFKEKDPSHLKQSFENLDEVKLTKACREFRNKTKANPTIEEINDFLGKIRTEFSNHLRSNEEIKLTITWLSLRKEKLLEQRQEQARIKAEQARIEAERLAKEQAELERVQRVNSAKQRQPQLKAKADAMKSKTFVFKNLYLGMPLADAQDIMIANESENESKFECDADNKVVKIVLNQNAIEKLFNLEERNVERFVKLFSTAYNINLKYSSDSDFNSGLFGSSSRFYNIYAHESDDGYKISIVKVNTTSTLVTETNFYSDESSSYYLVLEKRKNKAERMKSFD